MELFDKKFVYLEWDDVLKDKEVFVADSLLELRRIVNNNNSSRFGHVCDSGFNFPFLFYGLNYSMAYYDPNYECKRAYVQGKMIQYRNKGDDKWMVTSSPSWIDRCEFRVKLDHEMWTTCIDGEGIVSVMPARVWNKDKGRQLIEGTEEKCKDYAIENYCKKCIHEVSICCSPRLGCMGFKKSNEESKNKRRKTNRELAQWVASGYGECICDDIAMSCWRYVCDEADIPVKDGVKIRGWDETEWHEPEVE